MKWSRWAALAAGGAALVWLFSTVRFDPLVQHAAAAALALPAALALHAVQLHLSGIAWRIAMGGPRLGAWQMLRIRWIREGVNSLLPLAHIGGQVVAVRLLVQAGIAPTLAIAGIILDLTFEAASQLVVTLAGIAVLLASHEDHAWFAWIAGGLGATALTVAGLVAAQRFGLLRLIEAALERTAARWPATAGWSLAGLHAMLLRRQSDHRATLAATLIHVVGWSLGTLEVWLFLRALDHEVGLGPAFVIEALGMAARSAGFAVPGAIGVQEGGFVLVCGLFGIGAETALALSVLKRLRELVVGAAALLVWHFAPTSQMEKA